MRLNQLLQPHNNNLDLFRVLAALLVIYGHAPAFVPNQIPSDFVYDILRFDYSGSLAVKFFFMLSGLLVTQSLLLCPATKPFLLKRAARIFPGLIVCLLFSVFVVGLSFTSLSAAAYLQHPQTWSYLLYNSTLISMQWELPGVFENANTRTVNGSLWTLPLEVICYICLAIFSVVVIRYSKFAASVLLLISIGLIFLGELFWPEYLKVFKEALMLGGCFCVGVFAALYQQRIVINAKGVVAGVVALLLLWLSPLQMLCFYIVLFYICLYLSGTRVFNQYLKIPGDPSYGIYIYGFVIQHLVAYYLPGQGLIVNQCAAALIALVVGYLSWYLVEMPALSWVKKKL
jgi:peptidoglycan/LPS O-acetylase OafA/YrhL